MNYFAYETIIGKIAIAEENNEINNVYFGTDKLPVDMNLYESPIIKEAQNQLEGYLKGDLKNFNLPLNPKGTSFQKKSWEELCKIPFGKTATYKEIAIRINNPKAYRAVGLANNKNPIPIFIPCHRVIGSNGKLVGFRGGLDIKEKLLSIEQRV